MTELLFHFLLFVVSCSLCLCDRVPIKINRDSSSVSSPYPSHSQPSTPHGSVIGAPSPSTFPSSSASIGSFPYTPNSLIPLHSPPNPLPSPPFPFSHFQRDSMKSIYDGDDPLDPLDSPKLKFSGKNFLQHQSPEEKNEIKAQYDADYNPYLLLKDQCFSVGFVTALYQLCPFANITVHHPLSVPATQYILGIFSSWSLSSTFQLSQNYIDGDLCSANTHERRSAQVQFRCFFPTTHSEIRVPQNSYLASVSSATDSADSSSSSSSASSSTTEAHQNPLQEIRGALESFRSSSEWLSLSSSVRSYILAHTFIDHITPSTSCSSSPPSSLFLYTPLACDPKEMHLIEQHDKSVAFKMENCIQALIVDVQRLQQSVQQMTHEQTTEQEVKLINEEENKVQNSATERSDLENMEPEALQRHIAKVCKHFLPQAFPHDHKNKPHSASKAAESSPITELKTADGAPPGEAMAEAKAESKTDLR